MDHSTDTIRNVRRSHHDTDATLSANWLGPIWARLTKIADPEVIFSHVTRITEVLEQASLEE